jgi:hypothetical protein
MSSEPGPNQQCVAPAGRAELWRLGYMLSFLRHQSLPGMVVRPWALQRGDMFYNVMVGWLVDWVGGLCRGFGGYATPISGKSSLFGVFQWSLGSAGCTMGVLFERKKTYIEERNLYSCLARSFEQSFPREDALGKEHSLIV